MQVQIPVDELVAALRPGARTADLRLIHIAGDVAVVASPWLAEAMAGGQLDAASSSVAVVSWLLAASAADTYRCRRGEGPLVTANGWLTTLLLAGMIAAALALGLSAAGWPALVRPSPLLGFWGDLVIISGLLAGWQLIYSRSAPVVDSRRRLLIVGSRDSAQAAAHLLERALPRDCVVVGFVADTVDEDLQTNGSGTRMVGTVDHLVELVHRHRASQVVLASHGEIGGRLVQQLADARAQGTEITTAFELYRALIGRLPLDDAPAYMLAALTAGGEQPFELYAPVKRLIDVSLALCGLLALAVAIPFIALVNALDSPGPLFYAQKRMGRAGRIFTMFKLRSMFVDAEQPGEVEWCRENDPRITHVGRLLRKSHLDETPQFWNILKGDMSLVGPRPERPEFVHALRTQIPCYSARHAVRPGLTGWAQVNYTYGNTERDALVKLEFDLFYIQHRCLLLDMQCMLRTVPSVALLRGT